MPDDAPVRYDSPESEAFIKAQWQDAKLNRVTCECGHQMPLRFAYRCYFCNAYFCSDCAPLHFGQTRAEWQAKKDLEDKCGDPTDGTDCCGGSDQEK